MIERYADGDGCTAIVPTHGVEPHPSGKSPKTRWGDRYIAKVASKSGTGQELWCIIWVAPASVEIQARWGCFSISLLGGCLTFPTEDMYLYRLRVLAYLGLESWARRFAEHSSEITNYLMGRLPDQRQDIAFSYVADLFVDNLTSDIV